MVELEMLRRDALNKRINGMAGGQRIIWSQKDVARIRDHITAIPERKFLDHELNAARREFSKDQGPNAVRREFSNAGIEIKTDAQPADRNFLFIVSARPVDLQNDSVDPAGIDCSGFNRNPAILNAHDSSALPIAISSRPWVAGQTLMAFARFPKAGVSADSDRVAAAIRAGLVRGASIGFVPLTWKFSKDPARPLGVDFSSVRLLEWSCCSIPCQPDCLVMGAVSGENSAGDTAVRQMEARALTATARKISGSIPDPVPMTREQRVAHAQALRRSIS